VTKDGSKRHFLCSGADALITDNVSQTLEMIEEIGNRSDLSRIIDRIKEYIS
jgi:hypothetical protein